MLSLTRVLTVKTCYQNFQKQTSYISVRNISDTVQRLERSQVEQCKIKVTIWPQHQHLPNPEIDFHFWIDPESRNRQLPNPEIDFYFWTHPETLQATPKATPKKPKPRCGLKFPRKISSTGSPTLLPCSPWRKNQTSMPGNESKTIQGNLLCRPSNNPWYLPGHSRSRARRQKNKESSAKWPLAGSKVLERLSNERKASWSFRSNWEDSSKKSLEICRSHSSTQGEKGNHLGVCSVIFICSLLNHHSLSKI